MGLLLVILTCQLSAELPSRVPSLFLAFWCPHCVGSRSIAWDYELKSKLATLAQPFQAQVPLVPITQEHDTGTLFKGAFQDIRSVWYARICQKIEYEPAKPVCIPTAATSAELWANT